MRLQSVCPIPHILDKKQESFFYYFSQRTFPYFLAATVMPGLPLLIPSSSIRSCLHHLSLTVGPFFLEPWHFSHPAGSITVPWLSAHTILISLESVSPLPPSTPKVVENRHSPFLLAQQYHFEAKSGKESTTKQLSYL